MFGRNQHGTHIDKADRFWIVLQGEMLNKCMTIICALEKLSAFVSQWNVYWFLLLWHYLKHYCCSLHIYRSLIVKATCCSQWLWMSMSILKTTLIKYTLTIECAQTGYARRNLKIHRGPNSDLHNNPSLMLSIVIPLFSRTIFAENTLLSHAWVPKEAGI